MAKPGIGAQWLRDNGYTKPRAKQLRKGLRNSQKDGASSLSKRFAAISEAEGREAAWTKVSQDGWETIKEFVEKHRHYDGHDCLCVPGATPKTIAQVQFCGRGISAARYMCLLTHGTPRIEGAMVRHKCGNGHLSCVNPAHVIWGQAGDNQGDANIHRAMDDATVEDKCRAVDARTSK